MGGVGVGGGPLLPSLPPLDAVAVRATPQARTPNSGALTTKSIFIAAVFVVALAVMLAVYLKFTG